VYTQVKESKNARLRTSTENAASDPLWALWCPEFYVKLVDDRGWTRAVYEDAMLDATVRISGAVPVARLTGPRRDRSPVRRRRGGQAKRRPDGRSRCDDGPGSSEGDMAVDDRASGGWLVGVALGGLGAVGVAAALVPFRSEIDNTNLALVLVLVVVVAAIVGGRTAGAVAAVTATLAFDFFLVAPYLSMRVDSADDVETMLILLAVGLLVGEVAARGRRARRHQERAAEAIDRVQRVAELVAGGSSLDAVIGSVRQEMTALLHLQDCWIEFPPFTWVPPRLERGGTIGGSEHRWSRTGFSLPEDGVELRPRPCCSSPSAGSRTR
jgi:hypothetical protein